MKSIDKLRTRIIDSTLSNQTREAFERIADEIETEIFEVRETTRKKHQAERVYWHNELHKILDAINGQERFWGDCMDYPLPEATVPPSEVAKRMLSERYMLLPVDADGVPIRMGDTVEGELLFDNATVKGTVTTYHIHDNDEPDTVYIKVDCGNGTWTIKELRIKRCHHVKPRTLEDVLRSYACDFADSSGPDYDEEITRKYAAEIRELLGFEINEPDTIRNELDDNGHIATPCHIGELIIGR